MDEHLILLQNVAGEILGYPKMVLNAEMSISSIKGWDSVAMVRILLTLEYEMTARFDTTGIAGLKKIGDILNLMNRTA